MKSSKDSSAQVFIGVIIFCLLMGLTQFLSYQLYLLNKVEERQRVITAASAAKNNLQAALSHSLSATKILAFVVEKYGVPDDFDTVAKGLIESNKFIDAIELVEGGTITKVYPFEGNEEAIGYNILKDPARNKEALKAIEKKELYFAGPIQLKQGGLAVVGRQPIFKEDKFWGFSVVLIKFSTLIKAIGIDKEIMDDFIFQLSKVNPDTQIEEFFLPLTGLFNKGDFVSVPVTLGEWNLYVKAKEEKTLMDVLPNILIGIIFSLTGGVFAWFIAKQPEKLREQVQEKAFQLSEAEMRYRAIVENSLQALFLSKSDGTILEANQAACKLFGFTENEFRRIGRQSIIDEQYENSLNMLNERKNNGSVHGELTGIKKTGERFSCEYSSVLFNDINGEMFASTMIADISERKRQMDQIKLLLNENIVSKNLFENVLNSISDGFVALDKNWVYTYINEKGASLVNHKPHQLIGKNIWAVFPEGLGKSFHTTYEKVMNERQSIMFLDYFQPWDKYFENRIYPSADGGITIFYTDVTDQIKTEEALKENSLLMAQAQSMAHLGNWQWVISSNIVTWSDELFAIYGVMKEGFKATFEGYLERLHPEDNARVQKTIMDALQRKEAVSFEERIIRPSGEVRYLKSWGLVVLNEQSEPVKMLGACLDITESKEAENKQTLIEQRFRSLVQEGSDLISILDANGNYMYVSPACVTILHRPHDDFFNTNAFDLVHEEDRKMVIDYFSMLDTHKKIVVPPFRFLDGQGNYRWLESTATNLLNDPAIRGLVVNSSEITERVNYIMAIEEQNKKLLEIAWTQSHVVRAPLARLMGLANLLTLKTVNLQEGSREELLGYIQNAAKDLDQVIRDIVHKTERINMTEKE